MSDPIENLWQERDALIRQREILSDIAFNSGFAWRSISTEVRSQVMDALLGSRGLHEKFIEWAIEFDKEWESRRDDGREDYYTDIDNFAADKLAQLVASIRLDG